ncbi:pentatricopeptide repeat-containing protein At2g17670 [Fagus crenata]
MGKVPQSLRSAIATTLVKKHFSPIPAESPTPPRKSHHFPKKPSRNTKTHDSPQIQTQTLFKSPNLSDAKNLFNSIISTNNKTPLDLRYHNSLLQSYASISTVHDSISLFRHMIKSHPSFSPDRSTFHILLSQSCKTPDPSLSPVHQILNLMCTHGFDPDRVTTDIAVRLLCLSGRVDNAVELVKELSLKHAVPDTYTYNFLVKHLCKSRALSLVHNFIEDMKENFNLKPDLVTYTILIDNVCNTKNLREAMRLVDVLNKEGFKPDCFVYNTIMKGYCMLSRGSEAIGVYNKMKEEGVEPDLVTYNTLIFGLAKSGRVKEARKILRIMAEKGHFPDAVTYTSMMNGMCREGDALGALALLEEMEARGCSPNSCTYSTLLHGLCKSRLLEKAIELYGVMKSGDMKLEAAAYATFVRALCREGRVAEAYGVFDYAVESKSLMDVAAYSALETSLKWLKKAKEQGKVI